jgi:hypothetical protein
LCCGNILKQWKIRKFIIITLFSRFKFIKFRPFTSWGDEGANGERSSEPSDVEDQVDQIDQAIEKRKPSKVVESNEKREVKNDESFKKRNTEDVFDGLVREKLVEECHRRKAVVKVKRLNLSATSSNICDQQTNARSSISEVESTNTSTYPTCSII